MHFSTDCSIRKLINKTFLPSKNNCTSDENKLVDDIYVETYCSSVQMVLVNENDTSYSGINGLNKSPSIIQKKIFLLPSLCKNFSFLGHIFFYLLLNYVVV